MKTRILLFLLLIIGSLQLKAQHPYVPMAVEGAQSLLYSVDYDFLPPWEDYYFGYRIGSDIEIEGTIYKEVYYRSFEPVYTNDGPSEPPLYLDNEYLIGAIRDDIPNKKVYAYLFQYPPNDWQICNLNQELLLYDFDMNIGDYFDDFCIVMAGQYIELNSIEEVFFADANRLVYYLTQSGFEFGYIYEGIGGDSGLLNTVWDHFEDAWISFLVYCVGEDVDCLSDYLIGIDEYDILNKITVYPNPVNNIIHITTPTNIDMLSFHVYDIYGKLLFAEISNLKEIDISNLNDGFYLLKIDTKQGNIIKKIVKRTSM